MYENGKNGHFHFPQLNEKYSNVLFYLRNDKNKYEITKIGAII